MLSIASNKRASRQIVAVMWLAFFDGVTGNVFGTRFILLARDAPCGLQQGRIFQRVSLENQPISPQLQQIFVRAVLGRPSLETHQDGFAWHGVLQSITHKAPPSRTVGHQPLGILQQTHSAENRRQTGSTPGVGRAHGSRHRLQLIPIQHVLQLRQRVIDKCGRHQAVKQSELEVRSRARIPLTVNKALRSKTFWEDPSCEKS